MGDRNAAAAPKIEGAGVRTECASKNWGHGRRTAAAAANNGGAFDSRCVVRVSSSPVSPASTKWKVLKSKREGRGGRRGEGGICLGHDGVGRRGNSWIILPDWRRVIGLISTNGEERLRPTTTPPSVGGKGNKFVPVQVNAPIASVDRIARGFMCTLTRVVKLSGRIARRSLLSSRRRTFLSVKTM